ncbi:MAG: hypothetical protein MMC23_007481 [Stictis urceolatum]|nr:hypothetical protein [Stictis urceolata]
MFSTLLVPLMLPFTVLALSPSNITNIIQSGNASALTSQDRITGWVDQPNFRGTWDILWTCLVTVFISTYTLLCLNVPPRSDSSLEIVFQRICWMCLAIMAPEIVLTYAAGQWSRARQSVEAFRKSGYPQWNMRMAFFADMGGFTLCPQNSISFPLNAKQLHWLVTNDKISYPEVSAEEMWDKSKQDRLAKIITTFQIGYLVLHCIGRAAQNLAITTLELNAVAIVVTSLMYAFIWLHKPASVRTAIRIHTRFSSSDLCSHPWAQTPLDFVDANMPGWSMNVQPFMKLPVIPPSRPIQHIPNDHFPTNPYGVQEYFLCFATLVFTSIHVAGWNFAFPSIAEQRLWRVCSLIMFGVTAMFWILETMASWVRLGRWRWLYFRLFDRKRLRSYEERKDEERLDRDPASLPLPWEFWSIAPIALLYGVARIYLIVEAFLELRDLEASAFVNVNWAKYIPHI